LRVGGDARLEESRARIAKPRSVGGDVHSVGVRDPGRGRCEDDDECEDRG